MKNFIKATAILVGTTVAGLAAWRKIESDRHRNDLWAEAERISDQQPAPVSSKQTTSVPAPRA